MAKLDKYQRFFRDVNRAYKKGIVCPVKDIHYRHSNQKEFGCALTAAYMANGNEVQDELNAHTEIREWAEKHYGFTNGEIGEIERFFDGNECSREEVTPAAKVAKRLSEKHQPIYEEDAR